MSRRHLKLHGKPQRGRYKHYEDKEYKIEELARLVKIQASEMKNENLSRICGD